MLKKSIIFNIFQNKFFQEEVFMNRHSFTYPQYCNVVGKNVIIEEMNFLSGRKKVRCLYYHKYNCCENGGCKNIYVRRKIENAETEYKNGTVEKADK